MNPFRVFLLLDIVGETTAAAAYHDINDDDDDDDRQQQQVRILHEKLTKLIFILSPFVIFFLLYFQPTTYGKLHSSNNNNNTTTTSTTTSTTSNNQQSSFLLKYLYLGPMLPARQCWMIFECPPLLWSIFGFWYMNNPSKFATSPNFVMLLSFTVHYIYRCIIYPLYFMSSNTKFPSLLLLATMPYTMINGL